MALHEFLKEHRGELIRGCADKAALRFAPDNTPSVVDHGVPLFLRQLEDSLRTELTTAVREPLDPDLGQSATLNGMELLRLGYTVDQVVHHYGDVCQAVTDLAIRRKATITTDEFRTLNRSLDEAIADAVTAFGQERDNEVFRQSTDLHLRLGVLAEEQRRLVDIALQTVAAIQSGKVPPQGATAAALVNTLKDLRDLVDRSLPEIRLITGISKSPLDG
jgi:hypothetical protein